MRQTSGIIINSEIFINSSHVVKIEKAKREDYTIEIYMTNDGETPISLIFEKEDDRDVIFNKIVMELYGNNYAIVNF
jgi:uncharacterized glyoxalase superfamily protein PhnB